MSRDFGQKPPTARTANGHVQTEAYMVMRYEGASGRREWIWNSRDGITPFCVQSRDGVDMHHGNWHLDRYEPFHVPAVGSRVFVDLTEEIARPRAIAYVDRCWDAPGVPMSAMFSEVGKAAAVDHFVRKWVSDWGGHSPVLIEVTEVLHALFAARAKAGHL
jgi:hypothetical protein